MSCRSEAAMVGTAQHRASASVTRPNAIYKVASGRRTDIAAVLDQILLELIDENDGGPGGFASQPSRSQKNRWPPARAALEGFIRAKQAARRPTLFQRDQARIARAAYRDFGKESGHLARLNFGDCFASALAKASGEPCSSRVAISSTPILRLRNKIRASSSTRMGKGSEFDFEQV